MIHSKSSRDLQKFHDPDITANGEKRAIVTLTHLKTVWFNTGSRCNLTCKGCYVESSPKNDLLAYLSVEEVRTFLDEIKNDSLPVEEVGFTGGEPFMNPEFCDILEEVLSRGFTSLVLTNSMKPMMKVKDRLFDIYRKYAPYLTLRVSIDHYEPKYHDQIRGKHAWNRMWDGLIWLVENNFNLSVAGRTCWEENENELRYGYMKLFTRHGIKIDAYDSASLVLFPEMDKKTDVPEITTACWHILGISPTTVMCATQRMVIKRKGANAPIVVPCTLLPYQKDFEMGTILAESFMPVKLNHSHCAKFCVLGGASCSG